MKRVVALLLIASVALFAAVAPQDLKMNAGTPMVKMPTAEIKAMPLVMENNDVRSLDINMSKAPSLAIDTNIVTVVYLEDFENGANGWTQFDGTAPAANAEWHLLDFGDGDSLWWCADLALNGYESNWYVALETPEIVLTPGDSTLSFYLDLNCETPGGEDPPYDGWDGGNVQISNDGGETWTILDPTGVPYNCTNLFSFGNIFNEPGTPGWGGVHEGIVEADLGAYIGDTVSVRFVFCADGGYDTHDNAGMYGMLVDSIDVAGDALYLGSVDDGLVSYSVNSAKGAYWNVEERTDSIPSPTHVLRNYIPGDTTYAILLEDYYVSPSITLPDESATLIYCNFEFLAGFGDLDAFPNKDFWRLEVSPDDGITWNAISNPTGDPSAPNYVYSQTIGAWYDFQYAYGEACDLTPFAGQTVKFRFYFRSDGDAPIGQGLLIDDFVVYSQPDLPKPIDVVAANDGAGNVNVSWKDMDGTYQLPKAFMATTPESETIGIYYGPARTYFGNDSTAGFGLGAPYTTGGKDFNFTNLDFALYDMNPYGDSISVALFGIDTSLHTLYWSDPMLPDTTSDFQTLDIASENIMWNGDFWVFVMWETGASFPICYLDDGSGVKIYYPGVGFYTDGSSSTPIGATGYGEVTYSGLEYNVYRRVTTETTLTLLNSAPLTTNTFVDDTADPLTEYEYYVVCTSDDFEGQMSEGSAVFVMPADIEEAKYDDGSAEEIFELAMDTMVVVKITPSSYPAKLEALRFAALWAGDVYKVKVFMDDNGMPGDSWLLIEPPVTAIEGWNTFKVINPLTATGSGIVLEEGSIWIGVKGATPGDYPAWLAADTDSYSGMATMQVPGGGWTSIAGYLRGNPMIRGYFDTDIDLTATEEIVPAEYALAQNYPNPFNPVTTIHFELEKSGMTTIDIFDITGRHVRTLANSEMATGAYDLRFDASALSSGVYFYRLTSGDFTAIKKMSLVK